MSAQPVAMKLTPAATVTRSKYLMGFIRVLSVCGSPRPFAVGFSCYLRIASSGSSARPFARTREDSSILQVILEIVVILLERFCVGLFASLGFVRQLLVILLQSLCACLAPVSYTHLTLPTSDLV